MIMAANDTVHIPGSGTYCSAISAEQLASLPKQEWQGRVHVAMTVTEAQRAVANILSHCRRASKVQRTEAALGVCLWPSHGTTHTGKGSDRSPSVLQASFINLANLTWYPDCNTYIHWAINDVMVLRCIQHWRVWLPD